MFTLAIIIGIIEIIGDIIIFFQFAPLLNGFGNFLLFGVMVINFIISVIPIWKIGENQVKIEELERTINTLIQSTQKSSQSNTPKDSTVSTHKEYRPFWNDESNSAKKPVKKATNPTNLSAEWICPNCKKVHKLYVTTCPCGTEQPDTFNF